MALVNSPVQRTVTLCAMYLAQGVPWGFMMITLPAYLAAQFRVGDSEIGKITAIILVPWSFKLIWAPLMDSFTLRSMGRRRAWIIGSEFMMALSLLGFLFISNPSQNLTLILWMYFIHNVFASMQDVCTDALAVDVLPPEEMGRMNGYMWGSKLIGKGVGAWALSLILAKYGLPACILVQVGLLLLIMLVPMLILERSGEKRFPWSAGAASADVGRSFRNPLEVGKDFLKAFSKLATFAYLFFAVSKLIGVGINEIVTKTLFTQHIQPNWTAVEFSRVLGLYAIVPIIIGAALGGLLADRFGRRVILIAGFGGYALAATIFAACPGLWDQRWFGIAYLITCETCYAIGSVGFLSMGMRISWTASAATVFTTYMTLSNVSHVLGNWIAGAVRKLFLEGQTGTAIFESYEMTFWFVALVSMLPLLLLLVVDPRKIDEARNADGGKVWSSEDEPQPADSEHAAVSQVQTNPT